MKNISDLDFRRVSSFIDGELDQNEVKILLQDMSRNTELKDLYFKMIELSETSKELKPIGFRTQIANLSLGNLMGIFTQKIVLPITIFSVGALLSYSILSTTLNINTEKSSSNLLLAQAISSVEAKQTLENIKNDEILQFASRHYAPAGASNLVPVAYKPKWIPSGFNSDPRLRNKFTNRLANKGFSIFINNPNTSNLPDGVYRKGNFVLIKKTHIHADKPHTVAIFGDIDVESGKKILDSIEPVK
tara:strand:+ start:1352 stop:2089 length:738 start_codon:yes stop_codon:yes gene_type:complete